MCNASTCQPRVGSTYHTTLRDLLNCRPSVRELAPFDVILLLSFRLWREKDILEYYRCYHDILFYETYFCQGHIEQPKVVSTMLSDINFIPYFLCVFIHTTCTMHVSTLSPYTYIFSCILFLLTLSTNVRTVHIYTQCWRSMPSWLTAFSSSILSRRWWLIILDSRGVFVYSIQHNVIMYTLHFNSRLISIWELCTVQEAQ